jgi:hypothetical protein
MLDISRPPKKNILGGAWNVGYITPSPKNDLRFITQFWLMLVFIDSKGCQTKNNGQTLTWVLINTLGPH